MAKTPDILVLHRKILHPDEVEMKQGYKFTTPLRTLIDVVEDGVLADDLLVLAVQDAKKKGLIIKHAIETDQRCPAKVAEKLLKMMEETDG